MVNQKRIQNAPRIQSLGRANAILDVIAGGDETGVSLSRVSKETGLNKTTAFNLLASLVTLRFVDQDRISRNYRLGFRNLELGRLVQQRLHVSNLARPVLADLCRKTNETVNLGLPDLYDLLVIDSLRGSQILHATATAGWRSQYHCTALGKACMSLWDSTMRQAVYDNCGLPRHTANTITETELLEIELNGYRDRGYAMDVEENEIGVNGVASSIRDGLGEICAAISVSGPANRLTEKTMTAIAPMVVNAATRISEAMGDRETGQLRRA